MCRECICSRTSVSTRAHLLERLPCSVLVKPPDAFHDCIGDHDVAERADHRRSIARRRPLSMAGDEPVLKHTAERLVSDGRTNAWPKRGRFAPSMGASTFCCMFRGSELTLGIQPPSLYAFTQPSQMIPSSAGATNARSGYTVRNVSQKPLSVTSTPSCTPPRGSYGDQ